jgi:bifunctional non-homologous end joining protein LigD
MARRPVPKSQRQYVKNSPAKLLAKSYANAQGTPYAGFIEPSLATLVEKIPSHGDWLHEIKYDGYRLQLHKKNGAVQAFTRRGYDWTGRFKSLVNAAWELDCFVAIVDGEVIVPTETGLSDFGALESDLGKKRSDRFIFYAFDILYIDGLDLRACRLDERKQVLEALIPKSRGLIQLSPTLEGAGPSLFKDACKLQLEGIVSKKKDGRYRSGRSPNWTKITCRTRDTFVVAGIAYKGTKFDGIYLGRRKEDELLYAGKVEHGFTTESEKALRQRAAKLKAKVQPLTTKIKKPKAQWLKPKLLVDVEYRALTGEGKLRHPSFKGLREDL